MTRRPFLARLGASLAALVACPGCLKRAEAEPLPQIVIPSRGAAGDWDALMNPRKGEWFVCPNGHRVAQALEDINEGEMNWGAKVGNWQMPEPAVGALTSCERCGAQFVCPVGFGAILVTETYWRRHGWPE